VPPKILGGGDDAAASAAAEQGPASGRKRGKGKAIAVVEDDAPETTGPKAGATRGERRPGARTKAGGKSAGRRR
jgi:hypothetical protein